MWCYGEDLPFLNFDETETPNIMDIKYADKVDRVISHVGVEACIIYIYMTNNDFIINCCSILFQ